MTGFIKRQLRQLPGTDVEDARAISEGLQPKAGRVQASLQRLEAADVT